MVEKSNSELVSAFQLGNREAFAQLVSRHQNLATTVAYSRTGDLQRSEDIAQQAFLIAWQKQDELKNPERFAPWLRSITNNLALNEVRLKANQQRKVTASIEATFEPSVDQPVDSPAIRSEQSEMLWSTLKKIPENYREPLILFYREGKSVHAVATQLDLSEDAVKQRLKRGRAMMKKEIEELVESMLFETRPQDAFASNTMSMLAVSATTKVATTVSAKAGVVGTKSLVGKMGFGLGAGATMGLVGTFLGLIGGLGGAWFGIKQGAKEATSQEEKDLHYSTFAKAAALMIASTILTLCLIIGLGGSWFYFPSIVLTQIVFVVGLIAIVLRFLVRQRQLHLIHGKPMAAVAFEQMAQPELDPTALARASQLSALGGVAGAWLWIVTLFIVFKAWVLVSVAIAATIAFTFYAWVQAPRQQSQSQRMKFAANLCAWSAIFQGAIFGVGHVYDLFGTADNYESIPFWAFAIGVPVFGVGIAMLLRFVAALLPSG